MNNIIKRPFAVSIKNYCLTLFYHCCHFQKLVLSKGDEAFEMWKLPEAQVYLKVFIFNITNRDEFISGKEDKLKFQEVGPYIYR